MTLYLFNPEHDYAIANNDANFVAPESARKFAEDCEGFMQSFSGTQSPSFKTIKVSSSENIIDNVEPWGWDKVIKKRLQKAGISAGLLPSDITLNHIRTLSHRQTASDAMKYLKSTLTDLALPQPAIRLHSYGEIEDYIQHTSGKNRLSILKAPYSGNGKGIIRIEKIPNNAQRNQLESILRRQGMLLGEPEYNVVKNFAMEFKCQDNKTTFCGYSLFETNSFSYDYNHLLSDSAIEDKLSNWISPLILESVKKAIIEFFDIEIAPHYEGYSGVDMFIYSDEGDFKINPMVEINLRYTMGLAARKIFDNLVHPDSQGILKVEHFDVPGMMLSHIRRQSESSPAIRKDGYLASGYLPLTQVNTETKYSICISISQKE